MHRGFLAWLAAIVAALFLTGPASANDQAVYDVELMGVKLGQFYLSSREVRGTYAAEARFRTSGVIAAFSDLQVSMSVEGRVRNGRFQPVRYREDVKAGQRRSAAELRYRGGVPSLTGEKMRRGEIPFVDPATQTGTLDPLTPTFMVLRDQPLAALCQLDRVLFDGARRTRITLQRAGRDGDRVRCTGHFTRLAGYSEADLARQSRVPMTLIYAPEGDLMRLTSLRFTSPFGQVRMTRR